MPGLERTQHRERVAWSRAWRKRQRLACVLALNLTTYAQAARELPQPRLERKTWRTGRRPPSAVG